MLCLTSSGVFIHRSIYSFIDLSISLHITIIIIISITIIIISIIIITIIIITIIVLFIFRERFSDLVQNFPRHASRVSSTKVARDLRRQVTDYYQLAQAGGFRAPGKSKVMNR
jgi:hypothetical protein